MRYKLATRKIARFLIWDLTILYWFGTSMVVGDIWNVKKTFCNVSGMAVVGSLAHTHSHIQNGVYYYSNNNSDVDNKLLPPLRSMFVLNSLTFTFFLTNFSIIHRPALLDWLLKFYVPKIILCWPAKLCHNLQLYHTFKWSWWILQFYKVPVSATYSTTPTQNTATTMLIC